MHPKAPRQPARPWRRRARGARLAFCLWLAGETTAAAAETITSARYTDPTNRYAHGVLGDDIEYGTLELTVSNTSPQRLFIQPVYKRSVITIKLPLNRVFEDLAPRLADIDLDGSNEVIVVESSVHTGAQLAIYDARGEKIAATPHIGTRFRWLAPIGAADLDGDGLVEIAYIDRPHLAKTLRIWRFQDGALTEIATLPGLTNHRIGEDFITGGIRDCGAGPELVIASADWQNIVSVRYDEDWMSETLGRFSPTAMNQAMACDL
ncbi:FG-GAP repeat domain-containing protein [Ruegeria lacuscaerulensis]|uniref:FG-GAP repeat domain-containing protein n=1 Tax=Ruegeria lacuscaerulensis TaxID=55218 RepID=UPI00158109BD|nr:VCBS repeat-containing protein [Ruegeria lacuscaerulensis]